jgi:chemotaxis protein methyltransferase CheR
MDATLNAEGEGRHEALDSGRLAAFLEQLYVRYHYDFRGYAHASMKRRLRAAMLHLGLRTPVQLEERVLADPESFAHLLGFLTVQVSDLFRDPPYWQALRFGVVPLLRTFPSLKVWIAGCSSGEEVWSLAILLHEEGLLERTLLYATDINGHALARAEAGVYEIDRAPAFTENHRRAGGRVPLSDYYSAAYGRVVFDKALKRRVVFADHSLATDSVFAEVQLVSCRNVLIYFERALQDRALGLFREALCHNGFIGLGSKETLRFSAHASAFDTVSMDARIWQKKRA